MLRPPHHASILEALRATARRAPASVALLAPGRKATSYDALVDQLEAIVALPARRRDRADGSGRGCASERPGSGRRGARHHRRRRVRTLAPDLPEAEFANQLTTLGVRAVMVLRGHETAARAAASSCGIPVIELDAGETAGSIACSGLSPGDAASRECGRHRRGSAVVHLGHDGFPEARPAHRTQSADVGGQRRGDAPTRADRSMPERDAALPHPRTRRRAFGSLVAGGSVVCTEGFRRARRSRMDRGVPTDLVHRGPDDPPGDVAGGALERRQGPRPAGDLPVRALVVGGAAGRRAARTSRQPSTSR